jgi:hypothetical protein
LQHEGQRELPRPLGATNRHEYLFDQALRRVQARSLVLLDQTGRNGSAPVTTDLASGCEGKRDEVRLTEECELLAGGCAAEPVAADRPRPILVIRDIQLSGGRGG